MERTTGLIGGSGPLKGHEITYDVLDLSDIQYPVYRLLRDHILLFVYLFVVNILDLYPTHILRSSLSSLLSHMYLILIHSLLHLP